ncbi:hypothetical protein EDD21DRAFT_353500 [Dissophora ornata]|nr:hypothetical protein EDD21DRAFT_353500 [Dissophora ornata]
MSEPKQRASAPLQELPLELYLYIVRFLDIEDLSRCVLVSRAMNRLFIEYLWANVRVSNLRQKDAFGSESGRAALIRYGRLIRTLKLSLEEPIEYFLQSTATEDERDDGYPRILKYCSMNTRTFLRHIQHDFLPQGLRELEFSPSGDLYPNMMRQMFRHLPPTLEKLTLRITIPNRMSCMQYDVESDAGRVQEQDESKGWLDTSSPADIHRRSIIELSIRGYLNEYEDTLSSPC